MARRRAGDAAERAIEALLWLRHSFATKERRFPGASGGSEKPKPLSLALKELDLNSLSLQTLKPSYLRRAEGATSAASYRRATESVANRCRLFAMRCRGNARDRPQQTNPFKDVDDAAAQDARARDAGYAPNRGNEGVDDAAAQRARAHDVGYAPLHPTSESGDAANPATRAVVADLLSLPQAAAAVDILQALPPKRRAQYISEEYTLYRAPGPHAEADAQPQQARPQRPPKPVTLTSTAEWAKAVTRMWRSGMIAFPRSIMAVCGVFAVTKPDGRLRMITDARPANWWFNPPEPVTLPSPDVIARIRAPSNGAIYVARTDAADFYHSFKTPKWMWSYFGLPRVQALSLPAEARAQWTRVHGREPADSEWLRPAMCTLPMGYAHAVLLAQEAHVELLNSMPDVFAREDRLGDPLCTDTTLRPGRVLHAVCIDDLLLFGLEPAEVGRRQGLYLEAGRSRGYTYKPEKLVLPTADGAPVLGMELHGTEGTLRLKPEKMMSLVEATRQAVASGAMKALDYQSLIGRWVWAVLPFRPALSVMSATFALVQRFKRGTVQLWPSVRRELLALADMAPLIAADLRAPQWHQIVASDASERGMGVVAVDPQRVQAMEPVGSTIPGVRGAVVSAPVAPAAVTVISARWRWQEHINVLEARAAHAALRWVLRHALPGGVRVPLWTDSAVVCYALRKGRSSSTPLNRLLRAMAADMLLSDARIDADWVQSAANPADEPSRR